MSKDILIIDDDQRNIFALTATLRARKYTCVSASSAQQGLAVIGKMDSIGIVLIDMMMPDMDGYEAVPEIKKKRPELPVIAVTAQAMVGDKEKCLAAGADDYISKPVDVDKLMSILKHFLG
jgi:two-component system cell cycle response regulator DivK